MENLLGIPGRHHNSWGTFDEELVHLHQVLLRLQKARLLMNPKKCYFFKRQVKYLGHNVIGQGAKTDLEKIRAIQDWSVPVNVSELRSFLGLCTYYRKFVKNFSHIAKSLHRLSENKPNFVWMKEN